MTGFSYQLYSSRKFPPLIETLRHLKKFGYTQVEGYGGVYGDLAALKNGLEETGLVMTSGHFSVETVEASPHRVLDIARAVGMTAIYCPMLDAAARPADADGYRQFGARLQKAAAPLIAEGLVFGWHNHDYELMPLADGAMPLAAMFDGGPQLSWQADIAWIVRAGADPFEWLDRYRDRLSAAHVKDIAPAGQSVEEGGWADVGRGTVDWPGIWTALRKTSAKLFVIEHDNPDDDRRFAARSIAFMQGLRS